MDATLPAQSTDALAKSSPPLSNVHGKLQPCERTTRTVPDPLQYCTVLEVLGEGSMVRGLDTHSILSLTQKKLHSGFGEQSQEEAVGSWRFSATQQCQAGESSTMLLSVDDITCPPIHGKGRLLQGWLHFTFGFRYGGN